MFAATRVTALGLTGSRVWWKKMHRPKLKMFQIWNKKTYPVPRNSSFWDVFFSWHTSASSCMANGDKSWPMFWIGCSTQMTWEFLWKSSHHDPPWKLKLHGMWQLLLKGNMGLIWIHKMNRCDWSAYRQTCCQPNKPNKCEWNWEVVDSKLLKDIFRDDTAEVATNSHVFKLSTFLALQIDSQGSKFMALIFDLCF